MRTTRQQARREPQRGQGKHSRRVANPFYPHPLDGPAQQST